MRTIHRCLLIIAAVACCAWPAGAQELVPTNLLALRKQATLARLGRFDAENRLAYYETMDRLANRLLNSSSHAVVRELKGTAFGSNYPRLVLIDRDGDGIPEEFAYLPAKGAASAEFGFLFDMTGEGKGSYFIFNGGVEPSSARLEKMIWRNYHLIDTNLDGRFDVMVVNSIGLHAEHVVDEGVSAWLYDRDFDGAYDDGEYLGPNVKQRLARTDGKFRVDYAWIGAKDIEPSGAREFDQNFAEALAAYAATLTSLPRRPPSTVAPADSGPATQQPEPHPAGRPLPAATGSYLVSAPAGEGWETNVDASRDRIEFKKATTRPSGRSLTTIEVFRNRCLWDGPYVTEQEVADDYLESEEAGMRAKGKGLYTLDTAEYGLVRSFSQQLYYLRYKTSGKARQDAALFLLFPASFATQHDFFEFLISESCASGSCPTPPRVELQPVFSVIESLRLK